MAQSPSGAYDAFLSYARADDHGFAASLFARLRTAGFTIWWDRQEMPNRGETFHHEIQRAIDASDRLIAVVSPAALESPYVRAEWDYAQLVAKVVVPILRVGASLDAIPSDLRRDDYSLLPSELSCFHCPDFRPERAEDEAFGELARILRQEVLAPAEALDVPPLPPHFVARREVLASLGNVLQADAFRPVVVTETARRTALLHGIPGSGKSVMAAAFAQSISVRRSFSDGVFWIDIGQDADPLACCRDISAAFGSVSDDGNSVRQAQKHLKRVLAGRRCLIVMDDVWEARAVEPIWKALGPRCRLLITARDKGLATTFGAATCFLDVLDDNAALSFIAQWAEVTIEALSPTARDVVAACGNLPLALALCGAMVKDGVPWSDILDALASANLAFVEHDLATYPHPHVMRAMQASVDFLGKAMPDAPQRYVDLAVFAGGRRVPESAILTLWRSSGMPADGDAHKLLAALDGKALLTVQGNMPRRTVGMHNLQWDYVRARAGDVTPLHARLVAGYRAQCAAGWATGPDDGYFFERIASHLLGAGFHDEVAALVSQDWMDAQFIRTQSHQAFAGDVGTAIHAACRQDPVNVLQLVRASVVFCALGELSTNVPLPALAVLALTDRAHQAHGFASLIVDPERRCEALRMLAEAAEESGDAERATSLLREAAGAALRIDEAKERDPALEQAVRELGEIAGWGEVASLAQPDAPEDSFSTTALEVLRDVGECERALALARRIADPEQRSAEVAAAIHAMIDAGQLDLAEEALSNDVAAASRGPLHWALAIALAATDPARALALIANEPDNPATELAEAIAAGKHDALDALGLIRNEPLRQRVAHSLAGAFAEAGDVERARRLVGSLPMDARDGCLYQVAAALGKRGLHADARELATAASEAFQPLILAQLADLACDHDFTAVGAELARTAVRLLPSARDEYHRVLILAWAARALARSGVREEAGATAVDAYEHLRALDKQLVYAAVEPVAMALIASGQTADAVTALSLVPNDGLKVLASGTIVQQLIEAEAFDDAVAAVGQLPDDWGRKRVLVKALPALIARGQHKRALTAARMITTDYYRDDVVPPLVDERIRAGAYQEAAETARLLSRNAGFEAMERVIHAMVDAGQADVATEIAGDSEALKMTVLEDIVRKHVKNGNADAARLVADAGLHDHARATLIETIAAAWVAAGRHDLAIESVEHAPPARRSSILSDISIAMSKAGAIEPALRAAGAADAGYHRETALAEVVRAYVGRGELDSAFAIARDIRSDSALDDPGRTPLLAIVSAAIERDSFGLAQRAAEAIGSPAARAEALADVSLALCRAGRLDQGAALVQRVFELSRTVGDEESRDEALCAIVQALVDRGEIDAALAVARDLGDQSLKAEALRLVARGEAAAGRLTEAVAIADSLNALPAFAARWCEADTLLDVADAAFTSGNRDEAIRLAERARQITVEAMARQDPSMRILLGDVPEQLVRVYAVFARSGRDAPDEDVFAGHADLLGDSRDELLRQMALAGARLDSGSNRSLAVVRKITPPRTRVLAFIEAGEIVRASGRTAFALDIAREAAGELADIDVDWWRVEAAGRAAELFIRAGGEVPQAVQDTCSTSTTDTIKDRDGESWPGLRPRCSADGCRDAAGHAAH